MGIIRSRSPSVCVFLAAAWLLLWPAASPAVDPGSLRASYIHNMSKFVEWPPGALGKDDRTFNVCVQGDEVISTLATALQDEVVGSRRIVVSALSRHAGGVGCQVLFINRSELWRMDTILAEIGARPVLTISDGGPFAKSGGMIELIPEGGRLVFEISQRAVERVGLTISSKVLALARAVHR